jgi:hypothetical protein
MIPKVCRVETIVPSFTFNPGKHALLYFAVVVVVVIVDVELGGSLFVGSFL